MVSVEQIGSGRLAITADMSDAFAIELCFAFVSEVIYTSTMTIWLTLYVGIVALRFLKLSFR